MLFFFSTSYLPAAFLHDPLVYLNFCVRFNKGNKIAEWTPLYPTYIHTIGTVGIGTLQKKGNHTNIIISLNWFEFQNFKENIRIVR